VEAGDRVAIPRDVLGVLPERRRQRLHAERLLVDLDADVELAEDAVETRVEVRDRETVRERKRAPLPIRSPDEELVADEVERDVERRAGVSERAARQPADVDVERCVPPVVARRSRREAHLPHDLRVQVQRVLRRAPVGDAEVGKLHAAIVDTRSFGGLPRRRSRRRIGSR
jgi:hypothetical protein